LMQLAVGKEKRAVLLDFYNIDWNGLWIDCPMDKNIWAIEVKDWELKVEVKGLLAQRNEPIDVTE
jgi:hypothetical protein